MNSHISAAILALILIPQDRHRIFSPVPVAFGGWVAHFGLLDRIRLEFRLKCPICSHDAKDHGKGLP